MSDKNGDFSKKRNVNVTRAMEKLYALPSSLGPAAESESLGLAAACESGTRMCSQEAGPTKKKTRRVPVVVLENIQQSDLADISLPLKLDCKKSSDYLNSSKKKAKAHLRKGRSGKKQITVAQKMDRCTEAEEEEKRFGARGSSTQTGTDSGNILGFKEMPCKRKRVSKKSAQVEGQRNDGKTKSKRGKNDGQTAAKVKKMKTKQESAEEITHGTPDNMVEEGRGEEWDETPAGPSMTPASSDSEFEWEDVEEIHEAWSPLKPDKKLQDVSIELPQNVISGVSQKRKKQFNWQDYIKREIRRMNKEQRESIHKAHLLTLLASALYRSRVCHDPDLAGLALSLIPPEIVCRRKWDLSLLNKVVRWFSAKFPSAVDEEELEGSTKCLAVTLGRRLQQGKAMTETELVLLFVVTLRTLKVDTRLVLSLQPIPLKEPSPSMSKRKRSPSSIRQAKKLTKQTQKIKQVTKQPNLGKRRKMPETSSDSNSSAELSSLPSRQQTKNSRPRRHASKTKLFVEFSDSDDEESSHSDYKPSRKSHVSAKEIEEIILSDDSDLDYVDVSKLRINRSGKQDLLPSRKIISDSDESGEVSSRDADMCDEWAEVYIEEEERWVTVDVVRGVVDSPELIEQHLSQPMVYVVGVDTEGSIKDVTKRYAAGWMTSTRLLREDRHGSWWNDTLALYSSSQEDRSKKEDLELHAKLLQKPLPTAIRDFKDHPLYALQRHLLKYEAIYPETAAVLGYCKGEPVYARECVHQLHTREKWLQEAQVVRPAEVPYKMVKHNRPEMVKKKLERQGILTTIHKDEPTVPLFGRWQTENYIPPPAVDGKVPRNDYGNVDLYLPCMLPQGTVHLQIPGLERVARKLNIDCAPAVVGFDFHSGWSHPVKDGYIVCEEYENLLIAAWEEDRQDRDKREKDKREKRAVDNWRKLTKTLLISQRLNRRYQVQNESKVKSPVQGEDLDGCTDDPADDVEKSWPRAKTDYCQQATSSKGQQSKGKKRQKTDDHSFPFEKL